MNTDKPLQSLQPLLHAALADLRVSGDSLQENLERLLNEGTEDANDALAIGESGETHSFLNASEVRNLLVRELNLSFEDITRYSPPADVLRLIPAETARAYTVMPLDVAGDRMKVGMMDPTDMDLLMDLHLVTGMSIDPVIADRISLEKLIAQFYKSSQGGIGGGFVDFSAEGKGIGSHAKAGTETKSKANTTGNSITLRRTAFTADAPIVRLVNEIISEAIHSGSSDIHFEPFEREMKVRMRQDGLLRVHRTINSKSKAEVISRLKIMSNLDIAEKRRPQDGRIRMQGGGQAVDIRVSTLPTEHGEKIVLRILDKSAVPLDLARLGLDAGRLALLQKTLKLPYGMILVTGPTGAGKTTTLYSALNLIKSPELNIVTVEDPIEYKLDGITQTAVKAEVNFTFANALRTILRQDPNVIMVGEIRDRDTAEIAIRAALTGHLVLSTLHTNDAASAVTRLLDMGIEPFLVSSAVSLIVAQRLVRRLCPHCAKEQPLDPETRLSLGGADTEALFKQGSGCHLCNKTGYSGRVGLFEVLPISASVRALINEKKDAAILRQKAVEEGMIGLREDGLQKAGAGLTTLEEVFRETA